jgi:ABC-2 type transport system permease protein
VKPLRAAVFAETLKVMRGRAVAATSLMLVAGVVALATSFALAARSGNTMVLARLGDLADGTPWEIYLGGATQITGAAGVLAAGVVLAWIFGREFADGTITGLFGLPVSRSRIAVAKSLVYLAWTALIATVLPALALGVGLLLDLGALTPDDLAATGRVGVLAFCSALVASPAALFATLSRGYLPGIAATVVVVASAQIAVLAGTGMWFPVATAALWAMAPTVVPVGALALVLTLPAVFLGSTVAAWSRMQLDR